MEEHPEGVQSCCLFLRWLSAQRLRGRRREEEEVILRRTLTSEVHRGAGATITELFLGLHLFTPVGLHLFTPVGLHLFTPVGCRGVGLLVV